MDKLDKLCYDLALVFARTKFERANAQGVIGILYPDNELQAEIQCLAKFFDDAYSELNSSDVPLFEHFKFENGI